MVSLARLEKLGLSTESLKKIFTNGESKRTAKQNAFLALLQSRINDGISQNIRDYRIWQAIDLAYDSAYLQTTPTLVRHVLASLNGAKTQDDLTQAQIFELCKVHQVPFDALFCAKTDGNRIKWEYSGPPTFFDVRVPIVKVYVITRLSRLFNERNKDPLLPYLPRIDTKRNRIKAEAITSLISKVSEDFGYSSVLRQQIFNCLMYTNALMFPQETWYTEEQENDDGTKRIVKEGIRYCCPRPERCFFDLRYPLSTLNTNTGVEYAAFWRLQKYADIKDNPNYYNKEVIPFGDQQWWSKEFSGQFFQEIYPCNFFPAGVGMPETTDREKRAAWYTTDLHDKAVFLTNMFMRLVPSQYDLGKYDSPIWLRFETATLNTVLWSEVMPYTPVLAMQYDSDGGRSRNASLALEIIPWQELYGNALSQLLLSTKQNLANFIFYDKRVIGVDAIKSIQNAGERIYQAANFIEFDSQEVARRLGSGAIDKAVHKVQLNTANTVELTNVLSVITTMLERMLGMSAQEIGQAASHEQTVPEVKITAASSESRLNFTGSFIDDFISAWKQQLWDAYQQFGSKEFLAQVSFESGKLEDILKELGFDVLDKPHDDPSKPVPVKVKDVKTIELDSFASRSNASPQEVDKQQANVLFQAVTAIANNQMLGPAVGPDPLLRIMTEATRALTGQRDLEFKRDEKSAEQAQVEQQKQQQLLQEVQQLAVQAIKQLEPEIVKASVAESAKEIGEPIAKAVTEMRQQLDELSKMVLKIEQLQNTMQRAGMVPNTMVSAPPPPVAPPVVA